MIMDDGPHVVHDADAPDLKGLVERFRSPEVKAMALMGSFARGDAGRFSDVDLLRFVKEEAKDQPSAVSHMIDGRLVVVCDIAPQKIDSWFTKPEVATQIVVGLRDAQSLWDPDGYFAEIHRRAREFVWDASMQAKADAYASREMVGWAEEAHKGLEGLRTGDVGRMLFHAMSPPLNGDARTSDHLRITKGSPGSVVLPPAPNNGNNWKTS